MLLHFLRGLALKVKLKTFSLHTELLENGGKQKTRRFSNLDNEPFQGCKIFGKVIDIGLVIKDYQND